MKNIKIKILIIILVIILSYSSFICIKKYIYKYSKNTNSQYITTNSNSNIKYLKYIVNDKTIKIIVNKISEKVNNINVEEKITNDPIIYDGLTLSNLTQKLNKNLNSTLSNKGEYFANYYKKTGLDPYLSVAIVLQESGCKWECSSLVKECNNIGGMQGNGVKCGNSNYLRFETLEDGINSYLDLLYKDYYSIGLTTPELMNSKYASSNEWSINVNKYINEIKNN